MFRTLLAASAVAAMLAIAPVTVSSAQAQGMRDGQTSGGMERDRGEGGERHGMERGGMERHGMERHGMRRMMARHIRHRMERRHMMHRDM